LDIKLGVRQEPHMFTGKNHWDFFGGLVA